MSHPEKIRIQALKYVDNGGAISDALEIYGVSRSSFQRWRIMSNETGSVAIPPRNTQPYKIDNEKLKSYINDNPSAYIEEIAEHFKLSTGGICEALKRLKISRKKKACYMLKEMTKFVELS
ncbi:MAG: hypothetical protein HOI53_05640 [Francisellaceae bacterium]|nr:hypothetical protein [Francisellaceae bacterium]